MSGQPPDGTTGLPEPPPLEERPTVGFSEVRTASRPQPAEEIVSARAGTGPFLSSGTLFGPYRIVRQLGSGGMGEVYEAEHEESSRRVALKVLSRGLAAPHDRQRFLREGRLAAKINHPNSVYVFGTEEIGEMPVITMELVPGGSLKDRVAEKGPLTPTAAVEAALQVIAGLEAAAALGVLHRDVKPSNCFVAADGTVKVGDYGLSISTAGREETQLTVTGTFLGTPSFASPEQLRCEELDVRSDIYSVGATLYYMLTGRPPFAEQQLARLISRILQGPPESPRKLRPHIPRGLEQVVLRCLKNDPAARSQNYVALRKALLPYTASAPGPATLLRRFAAGTFDVLLFLMPLEAALSDTQTVVIEAGPLLAYFILQSTCFGLAEGLWGASIGKALTGIRLVSVRGEPARLPQALLRALVFSTVTTLLPQLVVLLLRGAGVGETGIELSALGCFAVLLGLLFTTARRANGYAGLHDLASGTRVVRRPAKAKEDVRRRLEVYPPILTDAASGERMGPYTVSVTLTSGEGEKLQLARDESLRRNVWIRTVPIGTRPTTGARQEVSRRARLRWLTGRRSDTEAWDAYEAPRGRPLWELAVERQPLPAVRAWLLDLVREWNTSRTEGTLPSPLTVDQVWITRQGVALLLDFSAPGIDGPHAGGEVSDPTDLRSLQALLHKAAIASLVGRDHLEGNFPLVPPMPLCLSFRDLLERLGRLDFGDAQALIGQLQKVQTAPAKLTSWRRFLQLSLSISPVLFMIVFVLLTRDPLLQVPPFELLAKVVLIHGLAAFPAALLLAFVFRGGLSMRLMGIAAVTRQGRLVSRGRALLRATVAWSPGLVVFLGFAILPGLPRSPVAMALAYLGLALGGAVWAIVRPDRGPQDLISGTYLVPR